MLCIERELETLVPRGKEPKSIALLEMVTQGAMAFPEQLNWCRLPWEVVTLICALENVPTERGQYITCIMPEIYINTSQPPSAIWFSSQIKVLLHFIHFSKLLGMCMAYI
jgi:hypothetical protein